MKEYFKQSEIDAVVESGKRVLAAIKNGTYEPPTNIITGGSGMAPEERLLFYKSGKFRGSIDYQGGLEQMEKDIKDGVYGKPGRVSDKYMSLNV